jgi:hypothetical protein
MKINLNGWRRIGVILVLIWISFNVISTINCYRNNNVNDVIYKTLPIGTVFEEGKVIFPNGRVLKTDSHKGVEPWNIDWNLYPDIPMEYQFNYRNLLFYLLIIPFFGWLLMELLIRIGSWITSWVMKGFGK